MLKSGAMQRRPWVIGNWKMNGSIAANEELLSGILSCADRWDMGKAPEVSVAVPAPYLFQALARFKGTGLTWGAQDVSAEASGAYTGEVAAVMLSDFHAGFSLVGHSERRARHGESDQVVAAKALRLAELGMTAVVCVGESLAVREQGRALDVVCGQVSQVLLPLKSAGVLERVVIAYEPVWAIGTGRSATPEQAQEVHAAIRETVAAMDSRVAATMRLLYGGSVKAESAARLFDCADIDGALVGGASLDAAEFSRIAEAAMSH
jgi:triosephosphate isomerase